MDKIHICEFVKPDIKLEKIGMEGRKLSENDGYIQKMKNKYEKINESTLIFLIMKFIQLESYFMNEKRTKILILKIVRFDKYFYFFLTTI